VVPVEHDRYRQLVAELFVKSRKPSQPEEEISLNAQMVGGFAYRYARYSGGCPNVALLVGIKAIAQEKQDRYMDCKLLNARGIIGVNTSFFSLFFAR
jgi:hypothetical protein